MSSRYCMSDSCWVVAEHQCAAMGMTDRQRLFRQPAENSNANPAPARCRTALISFAFEEIVAVRPAAADQLRQARQQIGRDEKRSPALILPHMRLLVRPALSERRVVEPENHVDERDRRKPQPGGQARQHRPEPASAELERAIMDL